MKTSVVMTLWKIYGLVYVCAKLATGGILIALEDRHSHGTDIGVPRPVTQSPVLLGKHRRGEDIINGIWLDDAEDRQDGGHADSLSENADTVYKVDGVIGRQNQPAVGLTPRNP